MRTPHNRKFANQVTSLVGGKLAQVDRKIFFLDDELETIAAFPRPHDSATRHKIVSRRNELLNIDGLRAIVHLRLTDDIFWALTVVEDFEDYDTDDEFPAIHVLGTGIDSGTRWVDFDHELLAGFISFWYEKGGVDSIL